MFRKDSFFLGTAVAIVFPVLFFGLIYLLNHLILKAGIAQLYLEKNIHVLLGISGNLLPLRIFFVNFKYDKAGRSVLFVTFLLTLAFFAAGKHLGVL
ncbi:MAG: hypothetical protein JXA03_07780 [Bacteroidales bacterium]|nr:hypothetical protein [Bacteroidales bacterium]